MAFNFTPGDPVYIHAVAMGYHNPNGMSQGQYARVLMDMAGLTPMLPPSPFNPAPLTPAQEQELADRKFADDLVVKVDAAMKSNFAAFIKANDERRALIISNMHTSGPPFIDDAAVKEYDRLQRLGQELFSYLNDIAGWGRNAGQPNHSTQAALLEGLKATYPDADAAVNGV